MAYYTQTLSRSLVERALETTSDFLRKIATRYARGRIYRTTLNELNALSNRDLEDLGLNRSMIRGLALEAAQHYSAR